MSKLKKYGVDALFFFPLIDAGANDFVTGPTIAAGDAKLFTDRQISTNIAAELVAFTSGSEEPTLGDTLVGATSSSEATFMFAVVTSGTWGGGDAAGFLFLKGLTGALQSENINIDGGTSNVLTIPGDSTAGLFASLGNGNYALALTATEMQCAMGTIHIIDSATKEWEDQAIHFETYGHPSAQHAVDLDDSVRLGLTALPNAAADAAGGLPISDAGGLDLDAIKAKTDSLTFTVAGDVDVNVQTWGGTAISTPPAVNATQISGDSTAADNLETAFDDTAGPVPWLGIVDQGTAQSATATTVVLRAGAAFADNTIKGSTIGVLGSTQGYWQFREITANTLDDDEVVVDTWTVTPTGTITYKIFGGPPALATLPEVNVTQVSGDSTAADTLELFAEALDQTTGQIDSGSFAAGAIDAAAIANGAIDAATFAADVDAEILSYLVDDATRIDASALNTASGAIGSNGSGLTEAGGTGDHLTALATAAELAKVPKSDGTATWNATALASIQSEANDALIAQNLDHLVKSAVDTNFATTVHLDSVIGHLADNGTTATFDRTTDSLEVMGAAAGGTDWTADEKTAIRSILGIPTSGTTPEDPTAGILDTIRDDTSELQTDWTDGGRLDLILDEILDDTGTNGVVVAAGSKSGYTISGTTTTFDALQTALNSAHGSGSWATATGFSTHSATDVWAAGTRTLTALDEDSTTLDIDAAVRSAVGLGSANLDTQLGDIPTVSEFNARTLAAADYFDPAADTVANVTTVGSVTTKTGYKLASDGLDLVVPADPSAIPVLGTASIVTWIGYFGLWSTAEVNSTDSSVTLRNSADNADLATHTISDDGTTFTSSEPA